jgi:stage II sporulation protein GA (sporulation sigma-E factor processing peptidase)
MNESPKVYVDLIFIINFVMDFLILWATARLTGAKIVYSRLLVAAIIGGFYAVGFFLPELAKWYSLPAKVLFSCLLIIFGLLPRNIAEFKKLFLYFYGINFTVAGAAIGASFLLGSETMIVSLSHFLLLGGVLAALIIGLFGERFIIKRVVPGLLKFGVELRFAEACCSGKGFLDTGNGLRDPLTNRPVVIAEYDFIKPCLPEDFKKAMEGFHDESEMLDELINSSWANRLRIIPFTSIGKKNGILVGVRADEVILNIGPQNVFHKNMVIGIYKEKLSLKENYQLLIPAEMVPKG